MRLSRLAASALTIASLPFAQPIIAAPVTVGTYYDETATGSCGVGTSCSITFTQLPSNMLLKVEKVHCWANGQSSPILSASLVIAASQGGPTIQRFLPLPLLMLGGGAISGSYYETIDTETGWLIGQGRFPIIQFGFLSGNYVVGQCTIIGQLVPPS
ncbi:hypothetical protein JQ594_29150 [Bradyrhizobium manausense]|uniref:hypothetical protein n=1 Tax=Bradyrhizobium manausense TaxID=989370 RepID=UPI001BA7BDBA|nr:hypothetical protein [Bradyrhizobium manausense]MBR0690008.1 hypothetical protein [Bradyrhizobium manausense]